MRSSLNMTSMWLNPETVDYAPSATVFYLLRTSARTKNPNEGLLAVGGVPYGRSNLKESAVTRGYGDAGLSDLPSSADEARAAVSALPNKLNALLIGSRATEATFKESTNHSMFHLAVHAVVNEARPDRAALVLLSDPVSGEDGFLQTSEVVQLAAECRPGRTVGLRYGRRSIRRRRRN